MKAHRLLVALLAASGLAGAAPASPPPSQEQGLRQSPASWVAFTHAHVQVSPTEALEDATLLVRDGRVSAVGRDVPVPAGALRYDLAGKWVFPGFVDPYTDYGVAEKDAEGSAEGRRGRRGGRRFEGGPPRYEAERNGAAAANEALHAEIRWVDRFAPDPKAAEKWLSRGVTTVASARMDGILRGRSFVASLGKGSAAELVLVPESHPFASFNKGSSKQVYPSSLMGSIALLRQSFLDAQWYQAARKAYAVNPDQPAPEVNRALEALAANRGPIVFETEEDLSLLRAARIAREAGQSFYFVGSGFEYQELDEIAALGAPIILPLAFPPTPSVGTLASERDVSLADLRHWEQAPGDAAALAGKGVRLAFTGFRLAEEEDLFDNLRTVVRRGLPRDKALAALTTVPAELLGVADRLGTLSPGRRADFAIADGDLFTNDDARLVAVWIDGRPAKENQPLDQADFRGGWRLGFDGSEYQLVVEREGGEVFGSLRRGEKETEASSLEVKGQVLTFQADLEPFGAKEILRFELEKRGAAVVGRVARGDGRIQAVTAQAAPEVAQAKKNDDGKGNDSHGRHGGKDRHKRQDEGPLVARFTYPNKAFGYASPPRQEDVLIQNATIWTVEAEGVLEGADMLVRGGKIAAIGKHLTAPPGVRVIDATGKHLSPGMIDEHSHLAISQDVNEGSNSVSAEVRIGDVVDPEDIGIYRALAGGTTTVQQLHGSANPIGGQAQISKLRWGRGAEAMKFAGAPPTIKFALGENVKQSNWGSEFTVRYPQTRMGVETLMRDRLLAARQYGEALEAWQKLSPAEQARRVPPRRDLQLEALLEILEAKRFVHCHSYVQSEMLMLMRLAEEMGFRVQTFTHVLEGYKVAPEMAAHGASASSFSDWWGYKFEVYDAIPWNTCLLAKAGVVTSINSDSEELVRRLNQEAAKSVTYCGMKPEEAIKLATLNPARQLRIDDRVGSLKVGKDADFVIWNGSPMSIYSRAEETWVDGARAFSREEDERMRREQAAEKSALVAKALAAGGDSHHGGGDYRHKKGEQVWHCEDVATDGTEESDEQAR
ncbi:MAG: amidohydrolase family protein [Thermoanaerobaculia bacterium]